MGQKRDPGLGADSESTHKVKQLRSLVGKTVPLWQLKTKEKVKDPISAAVIELHHIPWTNVRISPLLRELPITSTREYKGNKIAHLEERLGSSRCAILHSRFERRQEARSQLSVSEGVVERFAVPN